MLKVTLARPPGTKPLSPPHAGALKEWTLLIYGTAEPPDPAHVRRARFTEGQGENGFGGEDEGQSLGLVGLASQGGVMPLPGPCDPECGPGGCQGPGPHHCTTCLNFFLKFKNNTR